MDIEALMTQQGMRGYTDNQRDTLVNDAVQVRQLAQIIQARLASTEIDGDRAGSAGRRARKVARRFGRVAKLLEKAAAECEGVNATYVRDVLELPARRARELEKKEQRRHRLGLAAGSAQAAVAKSLDKSTHTLTHTAPPVSVQVTAVPPVPQYVSPYPHQFPGHTASGQHQPVDIGDFFPSQEAL